MSLSKAAKRSFAKVLILVNPGGLLVGIHLGFPMAFTIAVGIGLLGSMAAHEFNA